MVLEYLDDGAQRLVLVLCLPLVDGVFATLLVTGAVETFSDIINVALTIFTGAGALAVLYSSAESRLHARKIVNQSIPILIIGAVAVAIIAPVFESIFYIERLQYAAGLALLAIAAGIAGIDLADKFSVPAIILTGMVLSTKGLDGIYLSAEYIMPALLTSIVAALVLYAATLVDVERMNLAYVRSGGALVLVLISISQFGFVIPSELGLAILTGSVLASLH